MVEFKYWQVVGYFSDWDIIKLYNETTLSEEFGELHQVVIDDISVNMYYLVNTGRYSAINAAYPITLSYYVLR